ncbi:Regulatory protein AfsR (plasmid) [Streptomyces sp. YIM 121038]|uniref:ATP-binding protein n=1 Tax=Streptomyces sp. YIM 121038 TaxID=2136401 RepID=UPI00110FFE2E|nr:ATP-binding protein [Streptomyces sp. YIM 121038]QCX82257.1 Regulatory protein AfsR [Streptomyces sp. YIM 121038]
MSGGHAGTTRNHLQQSSVSAPVVQAGEIGAVHLHALAPVVPPPPRQLLPVPATWTDRKSALRELSDAAKACPDYASALVVISGPGGVGKTGLATKWLTDRCGDCPDGQVYAELSSPPGEPAAAVVRRVLRHFLRALGHRPDADDVHELAAWWRSASYGRRLGVLLDNARADQVLALLPGGPGHLVVVTSREPLDALNAHGAFPYDLEPLDPAAAERLMARIAGRDRARGQRAALGAIAARCAYLPLPLVVAATSASACSAGGLSTLAHALSHTSASPLRSEGPRTVTSVLDQACDGLPDSTARRVYRLLSMVPLTEFDIDTAARACDLTPDQAAAALHHLFGARLLEPLGHRPGRDGTSYRFHDEVRPHAQQQATQVDGNKAVQDAVRGTGEWLLATFTRAERILTPHHRTLDRTLTRPVPPVDFSQGDGDEERGARAWVEAHMDDLAQMVREAARRQWHPMVWQLVHAAWPGVHILRLHDLSCELHRLGVTAAEACGDRMAQREMLTTGVIALRGLRRFGDGFTWATRAYALAREDGDRRSEGQATHEMALCAKGQGDQVTAVALLREALEICQEIGDRRAAALTRIVLGQIELENGRVTEASDHTGPAHVDLRAEGDLINAGRAALLLAETYAPPYGPSSARVRDLLDLAEADFHTTGTLSGQARLLRVRGNFAAREDDLEAARDYYTAALALYQTFSAHDADELADLLKSLPDERASPAL